MKSFKMYFLMGLVLSMMSVSAEAGIFSWLKKLLGGKKSETTSRPSDNGGGNGGGGGGGDRPQWPGTTPAPTKPEQICEEVEVDAPDMEIPPEKEPLTFSPGRLTVRTGLAPRVEGCEWEPSVNDGFVPKRKVKKQVCHDKPVQCIAFNMNFYTEENSGAKIASIIDGAKNRAAKFEEVYAPLAVYIQSKTGYPASALIGQWAYEANYGTSKQARVNNNIGGHSCGKNNPGYTYPTSNHLPEYILPVKEVKCTYKRPRNEGGRYVTFKNIFDASMSQVYNIIDYPKTADSYAELRETIKEAQQKGVKADPFEVIKGLTSYAAFPNDYTTNLANLVTKRGYLQYDQKEVCK